MELVAGSKMTLPNLCMEPWLHSAVAVENLVQISYFGTVNYL